MGERIEILRQKVSRLVSLFLDSSSESEISKFLTWKEKLSCIKIYLYVYRCNHNAKFFDLVYLYLYLNK